MFYTLLCVLLFCDCLDGEEKAGCFNLIVFLMSCDCFCSVALPHYAVGVLWYFLTILKFLTKL